LESPHKTAFTDDSTAHNRQNAPYLFSIIYYLVSKPVRMDDSQASLARAPLAQGIEAEIPQADRREAEELKRKARSPLAAMRPKTKKA
jgi:hypothetical protein